ncbi:hypothetical protein CEXT_337301 [Caerostris extrusa]|uniref:Uncharacterized protein n=1 Tax=Caerostris extrusa TaxID=172846 RepID=A0AAV4NHM7_CAEEX|nr:hypothetical protein CEXT_337301 [Caerostris extrusa]
MWYENRIGRRFRIMLLQFILVISVISSSARTIDTNRTTSLDPVETVNQKEILRVTEIKDNCLYSTMTLVKSLNRAIDSLGIIRDGYQVGRLFTAKHI